jgi:hypothetical protein
MTIDQNEAYYFLRMLATRKAKAETRFNTLVSLNGVKNNPVIDDKIEEAKTNMHTTDNLFRQFKCMCNLQPSEEVEINAILNDEDSSTIAKAYNDYISTIDY